MSDTECCGVPEWCSKDDCELNQIGHQAHDIKLSDTVFHCKGYPLTKPKPKVSVRWEAPPKGKAYDLHKMWVGRCAGCNYTTQYWAWGATLGRMFEHQWKGCKGENCRPTDIQRKNAIDPEILPPRVERFGGKVVYDEHS